MAKKLKLIDTATLTKFRKGLGMDQTSFWARVGVNQSAGSRYETGRRVSRPITLLLTVAYGKDEDATRLVEALRGRE